MAMMNDPALRFSQLRGKAGDLDEQARTDLADLATHHLQIGWTEAQVEELGADFRAWWKEDVGAARQYLAEAAGEARVFLGKLAGQYRPPLHGARFDD